MQGLFERNVHNHMQANGFQMLGVDVMRNRREKEEDREKKIWLDFARGWTLEQQHQAIEYVLLRGYSNKLAEDKENFTRYVKKVLNLKTQNGVRSLVFQQFVNAYVNFKPLLDIKDETKPLKREVFQDFYDAVVGNDAPPRAQAPMEYMVQGGQGGQVTKLWLETTLKEWTELFLDRFANSDNFADLDPNISLSQEEERFNAYKSLPMLYNHMMNRYLISVCASQFHVVLCGSLARDQLITLGGKDDPLLDEKFIDGGINEDAFWTKHGRTRTLCLKLLLLYNFFPVQADELVQMCLRKAFGFIATVTTYQFDGEKLLPNEEAALFFRDRKREEFEKQLKEIQKMDDFQPLCNEEHEADRGDLDYAHLVKGAMVNTDLRVVWAPEDESFLPRVDDEAFLNVMWNFIKKMVDDGLGADRSRWTAGDAKIMAGRIKYVKEVMRQAWVRSQNFQLSKEVVMAEDDILSRLKEEQPLSNHKDRLDAREFRQNAGIRKRWASAVGKRMLTQRLATRGRVSIMEHQRSAAWAEAEYKSLRCEVLKYVRGL